MGGGTNFFMNPVESLNGAKKPILELNAVYVSC